MVFNAYVSLTGAVGAGSKLDTAHQTISELEVQITRTKPTIEKLRKEIEAHPVATAACSRPSRSYCVFE